MPDTMQGLKNGLESQTELSDVVLGRFRQQSKIPTPTKWMEWMSQRKQRETKQQPAMLPCPAVSGCCLVSFCFLFDIQSIHSVIIMNQFFLTFLARES